jgi:hypothetical protein
MGRHSVVSSRVSFAGLLATLLLLLAFAATTATAAAPKPDSHDSALARQLAAKVETFRAIAGSGAKSNSSLDKCAYLKNHPKDAFAALFALLPAILVVVVNEYKPQLVDLQTTVAGMHADSPVFQQWLTGESRSLSLILEFDNHGKKVNLCQVATVMLAKTTSPGELQKVLGIDPLLIANLFSKSATAESEQIEKLNPIMQTFFVAAGVSKKDAATMTSSTT